MRSTRFPIHENPSVNVKIFAKLWPYLFEFKKRVALALICLILAKVASVALPFVLKHLVDGLNSETGSTGDTTTDTVIMVGSVILALVFAYGFLRFCNVILGEVRDTLFGRVTERAMRRLGLEVFKHLHALPVRFHLARQTGGLSRDIERGVSGISFLMRFMVFNIGPTILELVMVLGILFYNYGFTFATVLAAAVVTYVVFSMKATDWRTQYVREQNQADNASSTKAIDSLLNFETVKYFASEKFEADRYDTGLADWEQARRKNRLSLFALNGGQALIIATAMTSMLGLAAMEVQKGNMTIGDFVLVNAFTMQIFMPLNFLGFVYREIRGSLANIENLFDLLATKPEVVDKANAKDLVVSEGRVSFKNVNFAYREDREILKGVTFSAAPGEKVAIVGSSGSGKSTLVKLLFRLYDITNQTNDSHNAGEIVIDNQNIADVTQTSLRKQIAIVPQDTVLFNDTLLANIKYSNPEASQTDIDMAIELSQLSQFIKKLPDGLETQVGERGLKLSGGEKQRVAIARAVLKQAKIIVFDEATSSLDSNAEKSITQALKQASAGLTSLVIAHRLSTIVDADRIVVMRDGEVIEQGTHDDLLKRRGEYYGLWQAQQNEEESTPKTEG